MLGEQLARELERAAPARSRQRSSFVRAALRRALDQLVDTSSSGGGRQGPDERRRRALSAIGRLGKKGPRKLSRRHDDDLAKAYR